MHRRSRILNDFRIYDDIYKVHRIIIGPIMTEKAILKEKLQSGFFFYGKKGMIIHMSSGILQN